MEREDIQLAQIYRPRKVADCILPDRLKKQFQEYVNQKAIPNMILTGTAGVGKTTVVEAMCKEIGCEYLKINGSDENGVDLLRHKLKAYASTYAMNGLRKVILIDEADYLTHNAQAIMRGVMEEFSRTCSFVLTCNFKSKLIEAIHSRAPIIEFRLIDREPVEMATEFFKRLKVILATENITCDDATLQAIVLKFFPDFRMTLNKLQHYAAQSGNKIGPEVLADNLDKGILVVLEHIKNKDYTKLCQWVAKYADDSAHVFRALFDIAPKKFTANTFADVILILGQYQYWSAFVADQEINLVACLTEIMQKAELR